MVRHYRWLARCLIACLIALVFTTPASGSPLSAPAAQTCTWTGTWDSNWGTMPLTQSGDQVTGTYEHDQGRITGRVQGNVLVGTWSEAPSRQPPNDAGDIRLTISADCNSFTGEWRYDSSGAFGSGWSGTRVGGQPPRTPAARQAVDLTGLWQDLPGGRAVYHIRQVGDQVYWAVDGTAFNSYFNIFVGTIEGDRIRGRWVDLPGSPTLGAGTLTLRIDSNNRLVKIEESAPYAVREWVRLGGGE